MLKIASEGYPFVAFFAVITITAFVFGNVWIALFPFILTVFMLYFFRDPERQIPDGENIFVSPADGKIILIKNIQGDTIPSLLKGNKDVIARSFSDEAIFESEIATPSARNDMAEVFTGENGFIEISIFMSPFNVHVNRAPCDGKIKNIQHNKGKFMAAYKDDASFKNENIEMELETKYGDILVRQVAGYVARRAVCRANIGDSLRRGERYGIIKFSSRLDVYLPKETAIKVKLGDKVKAGETVIGVVE
ncbi:MAG TPA: phosphatidylserine decarboxylase family protein [Nitrospiraceae bacterium]|nr:phosphatidylserine decarboxylase family protein [Nitrospiraceae bacterium]